jgi:excisionase family DNA binding protein
MDIILQIESWGRCLTVEELADVIALSPKTLYRMIKAKKLPAIHMGGQIRLNPQSTADWLRSRLS